MKPGGSNRSFSVGLPQLVVRNEPPKGFLERWFGPHDPPDTVIVKVKAPKYYYNRSDIFIDDLEELLGQSLWFITLPYLINFLFYMFLQQVRSGIEMKSFLESLIVKYKKTMKVERLVEQKENHYVLQSSEVANLKDYYILEIEMKRKRYSRGQVYLYDMKLLDPTFSLTMDELVSYLFLHFVDQIRLDKTDELILSLIDNLNEYEE